MVKNEAGVLQGRPDDELLPPAAALIINWQALLERRTPQ